MPPGLSPVHLIVIFVVALIVLGPDKMPEAIAKGVRLLGEARQWSTRISRELQEAVSLQEQEPFPSMGFVDDAQHDLGPPVASGVASAAQTIWPAAVCSVGCPAPAETQSGSGPALTSAKETS